MQEALVAVSHPLLAPAETVDPGLNGEKSKVWASHRDRLQNNSDKVFYTRTLQQVSSGGSCRLKVKGGDLLEGVLAYGVCLVDSFL